MFFLGCPSIDYTIKKHDILTENGDQTYSTVLWEVDCYLPLFFFLAPMCYLNVFLKGCSAVLISNLKNQFWVVTLMFVCPRLVQFSSMSHFGSAIRELTRKSRPFRLEKVKKFRFLPIKLFCVRFYVVMLVCSISGSRSSKMGFCNTS